MLIDCTDAYVMMTPEGTSALERGANNPGPQHSELACSRMITHFTFRRLTKPTTIR